MSKLLRAIVLSLVTYLLPGIVFAAPQDDIAYPARDSGKAVFDYYCYQCHGYSGDAKTLASTYLDPAPRNFTATDPSRLSFPAMVNTVTHGKSGTGMVGFSRVLNPEEIHSVVDYIRKTFMQNSPARQPYHSPENGWIDHDRYRTAFPFATGEIQLDTPWDKLDENQRRGKRLYMNSCISCHDRASVIDEGPAWELRALSFPRKHYSHKQPVADIISGASPYALHDVTPENINLSVTTQRGERLFQDNCAFCHAADGTGRNWIGSFLDSRPRDLTGSRVKEMNEQQLEEVILGGIPHSSMPAWRHVLSKIQISDIIAYIKQVLPVNISTRSIPDDNS